DWGTPYTAEDKNDPESLNPSSSSRDLVARGGNYTSTAAGCRSSSRARLQWMTPDNRVGFRLVRTY
ncbi:MAG: hypothetical protein WAV84_11260, partial [Bacteroidota bacterium]